MSFPSYSETEKKTTSLNLSVAVIDTLKRIAKEERRSVSFIAEELISKALQRQDEEVQPA